MEITTEQLKLIPLTMEQLRCYIPAPEQLEQELGCEVSRDIVTDRLRRAIGMKIVKMESNRGENDHSSGNPIRFFRYC